MQVVYYRFIFIFYKIQIKKWTHSKEFKEKYIDTNHPYPPLLNLDKINHKKIRAEIAWELNIPLPEKYNFMLLSINGNGASALVLFFEECNIYTNARFDTDRINYVQLFNNMIKKNKVNKYIALWIKGHAFENEKFCSLVTKKIPAICVVRDPFSMLKPFFNHLGDYSNVPIITLNCEYNDIILKPQYLFPDKYGNPSITAFNDVMEYLTNHEFLLNKYISLLSKNITNIHYIPFEAIDTKHAFETFIELSKQYGFTTPTNPKPFQTKINRGGRRSVLFPFTLQCDISQNINVYVVLHTDVRLIDDKYIIITDKVLSNKPSFDYKIEVIIEKEIYDKLIQDYTLLQKVKDYLDGYMKYLEKIEDEESKKHVTEKDILQYLKNHKGICIQLKDIFDSEFQHLKANRPDIMDTWIYYKEFQNICKEHNLN